MKIVLDTIKKYRLLTKSDKVVVAASGGKDSCTVLHILNEMGYSPEALSVNLEIGEWSQKNLENLRKFCSDEGIRLHVIDIKKELGYSMCYIRSVIQSKKKLSNCTICGTIRRWIINRKARELGATKLVTGHNLDDEAQTFLMNLFKNNDISGMGPKTGITQDRMFVQRVKPLYFVTEAEIKDYSMKMKFPVIYRPCPCRVDSFRKSILVELDKLGPKVKRNLVRHLGEIVPVRKGGRIAYCERCGEPARNSVCKACEMIATIRGPA